ncbi:MAG: hypothetical protein QOH36_940 [Actinomycetota bacterium]|nr:hypothetical protein [Actinomycetota bacterium]
MTRLLLRETVQKPFGSVSADFRIWLSPTIVAVFAVVMMISAFRGRGFVLGPALGAVALFVIAMWLFARLARRCKRDYPEVWRRL